MAEDAIAKARAIAAKLGQQMMASAPAPAPLPPFTPQMAAAASFDDNSELGKRKNRWGEDGGGGGSGPPATDPATAAALAAALAGAAVATQKRQKKLWVPDPTADLNYASVIIGPKGSSLHAMQDRTGAKIFIRGRGSQQDGPEADEPQHVVLEGSEAAVDAAEREINRIFTDPAHAMAVKQQQLAARNSNNQTGYQHGGGYPGAGYQPAYAGGYGAPGGGYGATPPASGGEEITVNMNVSNLLIGSIIGRGGENVQRLQREYAIQVQIGRVQDLPAGSTERPVILKGAPGPVNACKAHIEQVLQEKERGGNSYVAGSDGAGGGAPAAFGESTTISIPVPNDKVGLVIGKGGGTIKGIQMRTGAHLQVPPQADADDPTRRTISITGPSKEAAERAVAEVQNVLAAQITGGAPGQPGALTPGSHPPGSKVVYMQIPDNRVGVIIGKGGSTIKDLQNRTGARVQIPSQPDGTSGTRTISISGVGDAPERARFEIDQLVNSGPPGSGAGYGGQGGPPPGAYGGGGYGAPMAQPPHQPYGAPVPYYPSPMGYADPYAQPPPPMGYYPPPMGYVADPYAAQQAGYYPPPQPGYGAPPPPAGQQPPPQQGQPPPQQQHQPPQQQQQQQQHQPPQQQQQQHQHQPAATQQQAAAPAPASAPAPATDNSQYHAQFWDYAAYYGEKHAREAYSSWAPPIGTTPPPHIKLPLPGQEHPPPAT